jgi:cytosine deaminase
MKIPDYHHYWLSNAHIPAVLLEDFAHLQTDRDGFALVNLEIKEGIISNISFNPLEITEIPVIDLKKKIILPKFIDVHTHLDKGHIWPRSPNLDGTFENALKVNTQDATIYQNAEDVYRRMEFGLKCSYAHGTSAIRTHLDGVRKQADLRCQIFQDLQKKWQDRIKLQAVSLISLDWFLKPEGIEIANKIAEIDGILGGFAVMNTNLELQLNKVFQLAKERNLALDFHVDENGDPDSICLQKVAETAIKTNFENPILCGHCCSLAVQDEQQVNRTIELVKQAKIKIVSLPLCNLYLQDRKANLTPIWRGITRVHELNNVGIPVAFASDNCRDPFYGFGDHDMLEVMSQSVKIAQLDTNYPEWIKSFTIVPSEIIGLPHLGRIQQGNSADFIIFNARHYSELFSRPQSDRLIFNRGKIINPTLPDYSELDDRGCIFTG